MLQERAARPDRTRSFNFAEQFSRGTTFRVWFYHSYYFREGNNNELKSLKRNGASIRDGVYNPLPSTNYFFASSASITSQTKWHSIWKSSFKWHLTRNFVNCAISFKFKFISNCQRALQACQSVSNVYES